MKFIAFAVFFLVTGSLQAQGYRVGDTIANFEAARVLNHSKQSGTFQSLGGTLTVLDFFGTWCVPCIKALPHLTEIKKEFKNLEVLLISNEPQEKLDAFIKKQASLTLPIVLDEEEKITNLFQPPSYPYSVIVNEQGKVMATVTDAAQINAALLTKLMAGTVMRNQPTQQPADGNTTTYNMTLSDNKAVQLSQKFIYAAKTGEDAANLIKQLSSLQEDWLVTTLNDDNEKKAFWINLYNGFTQLMLKNDPEKYTSRNRFFKAKQIDVGGNMYSLDDIEHGILRRSKTKWSLGYVNKLFPGKSEKKLRVDTLDNRLHFALNCGAKSCPPIAFYQPETIDAQLNLATKSYLTSEVVYDAATNTVQVPAILSWFRADFGGKKGIKKLLHQVAVLPAGTDPKIKFSKYDWTLTLNNYKQANE